MGARDECREGYLLANVGSPGARDRDKRKRLSLPDVGNRHTRLLSEREGMFRHFALRGLHYDKQRALPC